MRVCVQRAGEVVYIPSGWWHATYNLPYDDADDAISVGIGGIGSSPGLHAVVSDGDLEGLKIAGALRGGDDTNHRSPPLPPF